MQKTKKSKEFFISGFRYTVIPLYRDAGIPAGYKKRAANLLEVSGCIYFF